MKSTILRNNRASVRGPQFGKILSRAHQTVPIVPYVLGGPAHLGHDLSRPFRGNHLDGIPRAYLQIIGIRFFAGNMDANFAADAALEVDFAPLLISLDDPAINLEQHNAINGANLEAGFAARAIVGVYDRQLFGYFFAWTLLGHGYGVLL